MRLEADRAISEGSPGSQTTSFYTTLDDTKKYIERNKPKVRSKEEALREISQQS